MKFVFLWVDEYKKLKNFQTSFGGKYSINYKNNELSISHNKLFISNFFEIAGKKIDLNLSAIVGENGTGKTTILDCITDYIDNIKINGKYIFIFEEDDRLLINSNFIKSQYINTKDEINYELTKSISVKKRLKNKQTFLFSNVFDVRYFAYKTKDDNSKLNTSSRINNISTNYLIATHENTEEFLNQDFSKQIFFMNEFKKNLEIDNLVKMPSKIYVKLNFSKETIENLIDEEYLSVEAIKFLEEFDPVNVSNIYFNLRKTEKIKEEILKALLQNFLIEVAYSLKKNDFDESILKLAYYSAKKEEEFFDIIKNNIVKHLKINKNDEKKQKKTEIFKQEVEKLSIIYSELSFFISKLSFLNDVNGWFVLSESHEVNNFINYYKNNFHDKNFLSFYWSEMSSGQFSLLNLFGRFYDSLNEIKEKVSYEKNLSDVDMSNFDYLILIDECDLYFHPQWQKDWLYYFIKLIEILFEGNVQVILTTHSPFILSDFPNTNVTFLTKEIDVQNLNIRNEMEGSPRTFGANINELFTNSFFVTDGLIGKFAKNKINVFISELMNYTPDEVLKHKTEIRKFIDVIGEPIIKNKLFQLFNDKLDLSNKDNFIEERIRLLEAQIKDLKSIKK